MSVTFTAAQWKNHPKFGNVIGPMYSCDCSARWCADCDYAWDHNESAPPMYTCEVCDHEVNLCNGNARDLLAWLGLDAGQDLCGYVEARELAAICRRRLWNEERNHDPAILANDRANLLGLELDGRVIMTDRRPGYLRENTERLLKVAIYAGDALVSWG